MSVHDSRVETGIRLLDKQMPGWADHVDLRTLEIESCTRCVVGQLFGFARPDDLWWGYKGLGVESPRRFGFSLDWDLGHRVTYGGLTRAWRRKIRERRRGAR